MDSTKDEENEYSSIDYDCLVVNRESTNSTSRRNSEGNTYEEPSSTVKKREQKMFEPGETLPLVKKEEGKKQNSQKSTICSIICGFLILFILLTSALALLFHFYYMEVMKLPDRGLKIREEAMQNEEIKNNTSALSRKVDEQKGVIDRQAADLRKLENSSSKLSETIHEQKTIISEKQATIDRHVADIGEARNNASALRQQVDELKAVIASHDVDTNQLINKINELTPEQTSVMLLGGWYTNSTTIYNSMEKNWKKCKLTLPHTLNEYGAALLNNEIYIFGGYENRITEKPLKSLYKLGAGNKWERMADMNEKRMFISQSSVAFNSEIWVIGGWDRTKVLKSVEKYNPKTKKWTEMPALSESRAVAAATVVDGKIYVSAGWDGQRTKNSVEVYDPEKGKWEIFSPITNTPSMLYGAQSHILIGNNSHLIAIGGYLSIGVPTNRVWKMNVLDPKREWKEMPSFKQKRQDHGAAIIDDELMVFGGWSNNFTKIDSVEIFDGVEWKNGAPLPEIRDAFASIPLTCAQERLFLKRFCQNS